MFSLRESVLLTVLQCDQAWPSCTPCIRAQLLCSGPPTEPKFVHSDYNAPTQEAPDQELLDVHWQPKVRGKVPNSLSDSLGWKSRASRVESLRARPNLTTHADRVASRLIRNLEHGPSRPLLWSTGCLEWMPARFSKSPALRDAVTVFLSSWLNLHKQLPVEDLVDPALQGKALRSLQRAVNDPAEQRTCETLAAATLVERVETMFCFHRGAKNVHTSGIQALMTNRGPPSLDDELDVCLALENQWLLVGLRRGELDADDGRWYHGS